MSFALLHKLKINSTQFMKNKIQTILGWLYNSRNQKILLLGAVLVFAVMMYILNLLFPLMIDDWQYSFVFADSPHRRVETLNDIYISQYNHYMIWSGRVVVHVIAQLLLMLDSFWQDILNTLVYVSLVCLIYKIGNFKNKANVFVFIAIVFVFSFFVPGFASTTLWLTGSANYLWGSMILILFIYPFYTYYRNGEDRYTAFKTVLYPFFGFIAGWSNENMSIALIFFMIVLMYDLKRRKKSIPLWAILGFIGFVIGTYFLISAPGNNARYINEAAMNNVEISGSLFSIGTILERFPKILFLYFKRILWLAVPYLVLLHYFKKQNKENREERTKILHSSLLFFASGNVAFFVMIASPGFPTRAFFGIMVLLIISIAILYANFDLKSELAKKINLAIAVAVVIACAFDYSSKYKTIHLIHDTLQERERVVIEGKMQGQKDFVFTDGIKVRDRYFFVDCSEDPDNWINRLYCEYYEINSVKVIQEKK